jgi:hypothetical protein
MWRRFSNHFLNAFICSVNSAPITRLKPGITSAPSKCWFKHALDHYEFAGCEKFLVGVALGRPEGLVIHSGWRDLALCVTRGFLKAHFIHTTSQPTQCSSTGLSTQHTALIQGVVHAG